MASFTVDGTKTTVAFEYTALTAKVQSIVNDVAESLWVEETDEDDVVTNPFDEASNQDKLDVVDAYVKMTILNKANSAKSNKAQKEERETEAESEHVIE